MIKTKTPRHLGGGNNSLTTEYLSNVSHRKQVTV